MLLHFPLLLQPSDKNRLPTASKVTKIGYPPHKNIQRIASCCCCCCITAAFFDFLIYDILTTYGTAP
jgi:hypothetical protein